LVGARFWSNSNRDHREAFSGFNLASADLSNVEFSGDIEGGQLAGATAAKAAFRGSWSNIDARGLKAHGTAFVLPTLTDVDFSGADLMVRVTEISTTRLARVPSASMMIPALLSMR
jgi:uncharacterized protein YjbI with pentapeptide repeats